MEGKTFVEVEEVTFFISFFFKENKIKTKNSDRLIATTGLSARSHGASSTAIATTAMNVGDTRHTEWGHYT